MKRVLNLLLTAALALLIALPAAAADNGFYLGGSFANSAIDTGSLGDVKINENANGYKVFGGYRFLTFLGVEASYVDLGSVKGTPTPGTEAEAKINGWTGHVTGYVPFGIGDIFAKAGVYSWNGDFKAIANSITSKSSKSGTDPAYGVGLQFRIKSWAIRGEAEYIDIKSADKVYVYSVGGSYTF